VESVYMHISATWHNQST